MERRVYEGIASDDTVSVRTVADHLLEGLRVKLDVIDLQLKYKMQAIQMEAKCEMKVIMEKYT